MSGFRQCLTLSLLFLIAGDLSEAGSTTAGLSYLAAVAHLIWAFIVLWRKP